mmetsp:Transcript_67432/g.161763  ORF Transcript_67432/g.161763 Transcript_67432/m.161763 type:complete len:580 (+) Transcript_67432:54-1793(+)
MVRKALCVGCNYPSKAFGLAGAVNDAFLLAECLQERCGFLPENICVLHDMHPGQKKSVKVDPSVKPTRVNVLQRLQWLVRNARPGDVLFFSFSGYGLQVDDMDGYQDEGYDEAILPTDFVDGRDGDYGVIVTDDIHDILLGIPQGCSCTVLMDCDHATSLIDVAGTLNGALVDGLKYQTFCGLKGHTTKVQLAEHNREVWQEERAREVKARPRFQPMMEIDNPRKGRLPTRPAMSRSSPVAFCFAAAGHGQTAMEMQINRVVDGVEVPRQHGVLTWSFVEALQELNFSCTYLEALEATKNQMKQLRQQLLPKLDQEVILTFSVPLSDPTRMIVFEPPNAQATSSGTAASRAGGASSVPVVVPPPPPGFLKAGGVSSAGDVGAAGDAARRRTTDPQLLAAAADDGEPGSPGPPPPPQPQRQNGRIGMIAAGPNYKPPGILAPPAAASNPMHRQQQPHCGSASPAGGSKSGRAAVDDDGSKGGGSLFAADFSVQEQLQGLQEKMQDWLGSLGWGQQVASNSKGRDPVQKAAAGSPAPAEATTTGGGMFAARSGGGGVNPWVTGTVAHQRPLDTMSQTASGR